MSKELESKKHDIRNGYAEWCRGEVTRTEAFRGFDEFVREVRAEAWDEGAAYVNSPFGIEPGMRNPYRDQENDA